MKKGESIKPTLKRFSKDTSVDDGDFKVLKWGKNISYNLLRQILFWISEHEKDKESSLHVRAKNLSRYLDGYDSKHWQIFIMDKLGTMDRKLTATLERHLELESERFIYLIWHTQLDLDEYKYYKYVDN